ncbi:MAG: hypothetical protein V3S69_01440, partial [Dehalococcoidales bacterium]
DPWTRHDTEWFVAYTVAVALDVHSTNRLIERYPDVHEHNPIVVATIGERPNTDELVVGAIFVAGVNFFIARALPSRYRRKYLAIWTLGHTALALKNFNLYVECTGPVYCDVPH